MDYEFQNSKIIQEFLIECRNDQALEETGTYIAAVTESLGAPASKENLLNKFYQDTKRIDKLDFGAIDDSKGCLTKFRQYTQLADGIANLELLCDGSTTPVIKVLRNLHNVVIAATQDFEYGYKTNNFLIISSYRICVANLYELLELGVVEATEYLRAKLGGKKSSTKRDKNPVFKSSLGFIDQYYNGSWKVVVDSFRRAKLEQMPATEAINPLDILSNATKVLSGGASTINAGNTSTLGGKASLANNLWNRTSKFITNIVGSTAGKVFAGVVGLFILIRTAVHYYFKISYKLSSAAKSNAEILRHTIDLNGEAPGVDTQRRVLNEFEKMSDKIDNKVFKAEKETRESISNSNRTSFNSENITSMNGMSFEL